MTNFRITKNDLKLWEAERLGWELQREQLRRLRIEQNLGLIASVFPIDTVNLLCHRFNTIRLSKFDVLRIFEQNPGQCYSINDLLKRGELPQVRFLPCKVSNICINFYRAGILTREKVRRGAYIYRYIQKVR